MLNLECWCWQAGGAETAAGLCGGVWIPKGSRYRNSSYFQRTEEVFKWHQRARAGCVLFLCPRDARRERLGAEKVKLT